MKPKQRPLFSPWVDYLCWYTIAVCFALFGLGWFLVDQGQGNAAIYVYFLSFLATLVGIGGIWLKMISAGVELIRGLWNTNDKPTPPDHPTEPPVTNPGETRP